MGLHGGNIKEAIQKYNVKNKDFLDFSANINPLGFPSGLKKLIRDNLDIILHYPDPDCKDIKDAFSSYLQIDKDNLLFGNGSIELIYLIAFALKPKRALIVTPTFSEYERAVDLSGGKCLFLNSNEEDKFKIKIEDMIKKLSFVDSVFLCNPNNPTGFLFDKKAVSFLAKECQKNGALLIIDEVFMDFVKEKDEMSMLEFAAQNTHILVLRSLTKFFALCGLRLGYLIGDKKLLRKISIYQQPWSVNSLAQLSAGEIIKDYVFIRTSREYLFRQRQELFESLKRIKFIRPYPPSANFIFCKLKGAVVNSGQLCEYCGRKGIFIRDCSNFRGLDDTFIRVAVKKSQENEKLLRVLRELQ